MSARKPLEDLFVAGNPGECWEWKGLMDTRGYGRFKVAGKYRRAHREVYEHLRGPIPWGLVIDHLCFNRRCVNPAHMEPVTDIENKRRQRSAMAGACVNGHEFTPENTYMRPNGRRQCRACNALAVANYARRRSAA